MARLNLMAGKTTGNQLVGLVAVSGCAVALVGGVLVSGGCGKGDRWWKDNDPMVEKDAGAEGVGEVDSSLSALSEDSEPVTVEGRTSLEGFGTTRERVVESARMMDEYFSGMAAEESLAQAVVIDDPADDVMDGGGDAGSGSGDGYGDGSGSDGSFSLSTAMAERAGDDELVDESVDKSADGQSDEEGLEPVEVVVVDAEQRKAELVSELIDVLTEQMRTSENPGEAAAALAGMESMTVEALEGLRDEGVLSETELSTLKAVREMFDAVVSSGEIASPGAVAEMLDRVRGDLDRASGIRVSRALLCTRVDGFGKYEPFANNEFIAGRAQEVIVYVEVDRFGHRELVGNDGQKRYEVEMSQRLELYHVADDLNTWNRAAEVDRSVSRNQVRDYYLINKITLPANLGVGRYHLKVVMRDLVDEKVGEMIIPIRMVVR